ncbi:L-lactate dehydrogenase [Phenylobacterium aquaticum]|uniref:L-lactate dehydrogenase n=1 Tax=Phenylobacterium aquaticum TaxID=1763816 RepID=UPI001F5D78D4|nr:L-lactate dehydrogenase [Phenylobacterium aquaticum]MCI3134564.1 L-lactate dehydrogenase [Phenylobacterium aquaticum]
MPPVSVSDYRELARRRLPPMFFEYIDGGSYAEVTLKRNVEDLEAIALRQRVMRDMTTINTSVQAVGQTLAMPLGLSPVGMAGMYGRRGETQAARAAAQAGVPFCLSTVGVCSVEEVAATGTAPWFQLYMLKDRGYMRSLLERAKAAGCPVLVFTVDLPLPGSRYRDVRSGFTGATGLSGLLNTGWQGATHLEWFWDVYVNGKPHTLGNVQDAVEGGRRVNDFLSWIARNFDRSVTWADLDFVREIWDGPIIIKGVLDPDDARDAVKAGAQGLIVSNHGGRQLDGVKSSIAALPRIADAVGDDLEVFLDGGVRSGLDVLKALALGARACFVGRPWAYALGAGGEKMISKMLGTLKSELVTAMILTGCDDVRRADKSLLDVGS